MAIYRLSVSVISRSSGRSAVAAAAYRCGECITNERDGREHDYLRRSGVEATEIIAPDHAPKWARDRAALWNAVEHSEKRKDAQTSREVALSLPHELGAEERRSLVREFAQEQFVARGMVADIAHHAPHGKGDERNHHAHVMLTTREITRDGFGQKDRTWNDKAVLQEWREQWEKHLNRSLERAGIEQRLDHRSLKEQYEEAKERAATEQDEEKKSIWEARAMETDREPEPKMGAAAAMERRGIRTALGDIVREVRDMRDTLKERAEVLIEKGRTVALEARERIGSALLEMGLRGMQAERASLDKSLRALGEKGVAREQAEKERQRELALEKIRERSRGMDLSR